MDVIILTDPNFPIFNVDSYRVAFIQFLLAETVYMWENIFSVRTIERLKYNRKMNVCFHSPSTVLVSSWYSEVIFSSRGWRLVLLVVVVVVYLMIVMVMERMER